MYFRFMYFMNSLPSIHDKAFASAIEVVMSSSQKQRKKQGTPGDIVHILKGFKGGKAKNGTNFPADFLFSFSSLVKYHICQKFPTGEEFLIDKTTPAGFVTLVFGFSCKECNKKFSVTSNVLVTSDDTFQCPSCNQHGRIVCSATALKGYWLEMIVHGEFDKRNKRKEHFIFTKSLIEAKERLNGVISLSASPCASLSARQTTPPPLAFVVAMLLAIALRRHFSEFAVKEATV
ncbi:hypothetical protein LXL04_032953 [Taraxacum kok-saghyz]